MLEKTVRILSFRAEGTSYRWNGLNTQTLKSATSFTRENSRQGEEVPSYAYKIKNFLDATSPFQATKFGYEVRPYKVKYFSTDNVPLSSIKNGEGSGFFHASGTPGFAFPTTPPNYSGPAFTTAYNLAVERLYETLRGYQSGSRLGETLGTLSQTYRMVSRPMAGLLDLADYVSWKHIRILKEKRRSVNRLAKSLADLTLEYRFGVLPLIKDLTDAAIAVQNRSNRVDFAKFNRSGKAETSTFSSGACGYTGCVGYSGLVSQRIYSKNRVRFKGCYKFEMPCPEEPYNQSLGLTWREFVPTVKDLIPYSFLVDYVSNLGTFVDAISVPWSGVVWCVQTSKVSTEYVFSYQPNPVQAPGFYTESFQQGYTRVWATGIKREDRNSMPLPILEWKYPSVRQWQNILALAAGRLPVIGALTKKLTRSPSGRELNYKFKLAVRDRNLKVPYPYH